MDLLRKFALPNHSKSMTIKNLYVSIFLLFSLTVFLFSFSTFASRPLENVAPEPDSMSSSPEVRPKHTELSFYKSLRLDQVGLSEETFAYAVKGYENLRTSSTLKDTQYLSIVDFSQSSRNKRFYLFDLKNHQLIKNTFVAYGKNSGVDMASSFSNKPGTEQSSLGFYITKETYVGKNGFSLKMAGVEERFNDNDEKRAIVVHGADYVNPNRVKSPYMGRSQGCPALPKSESGEIIELIKGGSALFVYAASGNYLQSSKLLNS